MKNFYKSINVFLFAFLFSTMTIAQITYVNHAAAGAGDGSSWANAYTDLSMAIDATAAGEVWIAAGTYTPSKIGLDTFNTFDISVEISIYGGFAGTETSKDERVDGENTTILSGDMLGNDTPNDLDVNKEDNIFHIMTCLAPAMSTIVLDGLTFQGGNTRESDVNNDYSWRGGAIYSFNALDINNCNFNNNYARSGGAVYIGPGGHESQIDNSTFEHNECFAQAAGVFVSGSNDVTVSNSTFSNNTTNRGALYPIDCQNFMVDNCIFQNNVSVTTENFGGAMFIWASTGTVQNCTFRNNSSGNGAAIFMNGTDLGITGTETFLFDNCTFTANSASDWGGAGLYFWNTTSRVQNCQFQSNSGNNGGAIYIDGRDMAPDVENFVFDNCTFNGNSSSEFGGGAMRSFASSYTMSNCDFMSNQGSVGGGILSNGDGQNVLSMNNTFSGNIADFGASQACYGTYSNFTLNNNTYEANLANTSGGGLINGFGSNVMVNNCEFRSNIARFGGAMYLQNDTTNVTVNNSDFIENTANTGNGGAINIGGPVTVTVDNSLFQENFGSFGGAINGSEGDVNIIEGYLHLSNSRILFNTADIQGAAISLVNLDLEMSNTVIGTNLLLGVGAGGGLSLNSTANRTATFNIVNSTIADNSAVIGAGISGFTEDATAQCNINLQNTILSNLGANYEIEAGTPTINSLGGNISSDATLETVLTNTGDKNNEPDMKFVNSANFDFSLENDSPAINIGVAAGAPATDIEGNPRVGPPDAGAYENQNPLSTDIIEKNKTLSLSPNPARTISTITLNNSWNGDVVISIQDAHGKLIKKEVKQKSIQEWKFSLDVSDLNTGLHFIILETKNQKLTSSFIKI